MLIRVHVQQIAAVDVAQVPKRAFLLALVQIHRAGIKVRGARPVRNGRKVKVIKSLPRTTTSTLIAAACDAAVGNPRPDCALVAGSNPDSLIDAFRIHEPGKQFVSVGIHRKLPAK